jgi:excisionase family DNA binding protein
VSGNSSSEARVQVPRLLSPREVSKVTGLQTFRVYQLIREGRLPAIRISRTFRVSETALNRWIEEEESRGAR